VTFIKNWFTPPASLSERTRKNFLNVQIDAIGVGLASAAGPFLSIFLARLGATSFQIGLLTTMPAIAGLLFAIPLGRLLQRQRKIVPWFSGARLAVLSSYFLTGLIAFLIPQSFLISATLVVWAIATIPQSLLSIAFSVVMNSVAGPTHRFDLMTRRWSTLGLTTAITVFLIGQFLDHSTFPNNYKLIFMGLSIGGLISYYFSSHISLDDLTPPLENPNDNQKKGFLKYLELIKSEPAFVNFVLKRFVFLSGTALAAPLFPLYFVREIKVSDSWIATITVAQSVVMIFGYFFWTRQSRIHGAKVALLWTTFGLSMYPFLTAFTHRPWMIALYAGMAGIFQAGLDLVFFDELMKTVPIEYSATFVSLAQSIQYVSSIASPIIGSFLADNIGIGPALVVSAAIRLTGFVLFALPFKSLKKN
jgi:hypothetical protein